MTKKFYITTPVYYASGSPHIGHAYSTVIADILARYKKMQGYDVYMLTGTDEHGEKIVDAANEAKLSVEKFVDKIALKEFKNLFDKLNINYSTFMRTTNKTHTQVIKKIFSKMIKNDFIYKGKYSGKYCVKCEAFYSDSQLVNGKCPDHNVELKFLSQESYMFKMSSFQKWIEKLLTDEGDKFASKNVQQELINNFIKPGLKDLSLTRKNITWGIITDEDKDHVIYVWLDALFSYLTAIGYRVDKNLKLFSEYWSNDSEIVHVIGQDITRFHCIYWPIFLKAMDLRLPSKIITHGLLRDKEGKKMSKSIGNVVDPNKLIDKFGVDAVRFYLAKEIRTGENGNINFDKIGETSNTYLANMYGNLVSRTIGMISKYFGGITPSYDGPKTKYCKNIELKFKEFHMNYINNMDSFNISSAINIIVKLLNEANKYIDLTQPWLLVKTSDEKVKLQAVMNNLMKAIEISSLMLEPIVTNSKELLLEQIPFKNYSLKDCLKHKNNDGLIVRKINNLYERF